MKVLRVLVAEDNEDHLFLATVALQTAKAADVEVIGVRDGAEALDFLERCMRPDGTVPHLVLLDLSMPRRNGLEVLAEMKGDDAMSSIPVVVLTSSNLPSDILTSYDLGANSYVTKGGYLTDLVDYWVETAQLPSR